jgi:hypothetical protein
VTDRRIVQSLAETAAQADAQRSVVAAGIESLASAEAQRQVAVSGIEALVWIQAPRSIAAGLVEVAWREPPRPAAFAWQHNWASPIVERLGWRTDVIISRDGTEYRVKLRAHPSRHLTLSALGHGDTGAMRLDVWMHGNQARVAYVPLWQAARRVAVAAASGDTVVQLDVVDARLLRMSQSATGTVGIGPALILDADGDYQMIDVIAYSQTLAQASAYLPLVRAAPAGAWFVPLARGRVGAASARQHTLIVAEYPIEAELDPWYWQGSFVPDLSLGGDPVLLDAQNWSDDPAIGYEARSDRLEVPIADAWVRRFDDRPQRALTRRYLAAGETQIERLLALLGYLAGRWAAVWLPVDIGQIPLLIAADAGATALVIAREHLPSVQEEPWRALLARPAGGAVQALRTSAWTSIDDAQARISLAAPLASALPAGTALEPLAYVRLDHDEVELTWHTREVIEIALRWRTVPEPPHRIHLTGT